MGGLIVNNIYANEWVAQFRSSISTEHNVAIDYSDIPANPAVSFLHMRTNVDTAADNKFRFQTDGNAYADGSWNGGGADYAEWFEKEGEIPEGSLIGLNPVTGKVRVWQTGDPFIGVQSINPGFIGNNVMGAETIEEEMKENYVLVALVGQVEINSSDLLEQGRKVSTSDGQFIGWRLSNGKVFIK